MMHYSDEAQQSATRGGDRRRNLITIRSEPQGRPGNSGQKFGRQNVPSVAVLPTVLKQSEGFTMPPDAATAAACRRDLPLTATAEVLPEWLDEMGHMNVMWYTHLFSKGVHGFFAMFGFTPEYMLGNLAGTFALELHVRYLSELRVGERVAIYSRALGRTAKRLHYMQFLVNDGKQVLSATGELVSAHVDMKVRRQAPLPEAITTEFDKLLAKHQALDWPAPTCGVMRA
jgi:acyl-CoA thioester hydrolase